MAWGKRARDILLWPCRPAVPKRTSRTIFVSEPDRNAVEGFIKNVVTTSRYTWYSFVPVFLFQQFSRLVNFYFLIICVLQSISSISITDGIPTSFLPLGFIILFDGIITVREDYVRHREDFKANNCKVTVMRGGKFVQLSWRDVAVGDVVKVFRGQEFPADLVFLSAGSEDPEQRCVCHVQTAQLDGETNLKLRRAPDDVFQLLSTDQDCAAFRARVVCEEPNEHFGLFTGNLFLPKQPEQGGAASSEQSAASSERCVLLDANNLLLRGCVLRNVEYIFGLVVYTGGETKVRVKQQAKSTKTAKVERYINTYTVYTVALLAGLCVASTFGYFYWHTEALNSTWYLQIKAPSTVGTVEQYFTFILQILNIVPLSLYVSMKLTRTAQKVFMDFDQECVYVNQEELARTGGESGRYPINVRVMDLNDELGQVTHLFSDKTGTLTSNYMEFRKLSINGVAYGLGTTQIGLARRRRMGKDIRELQLLMDKAENSSSRVPHVNFIDGCESDPLRVLLGPDGDLFGTGARKDPVHAAALRLFLLQLAINHTVVLESILDRDTHAVTGTQLSASSPDEEAFVLAATFFGMKFAKRVKDVVTLEIRGKTYEYRIVAMLPYTQMRKMMSLVIEDLQATASGDESRRYLLLCKGADSKILSLLEDGSTEIPLPSPATDRSLSTEGQQLVARISVIEKTKLHMEEWAKDGLRTLCFACKPLAAKDLERWVEEYNEILSNIEERQKRDAKQPNRIDAHMEALETGLTLQGATANEDKLQEQVPETIARLAEAGIKVFMLTGDKQETAVNVGFAASMLTNEFERILLTSEEVSDIGTIPALLAARAKELREMARHGRESASPLCIVLDEPVIDLVMGDHENRRNFLVVAEACKTVICCRCRPDQKKQVVQLVRLGVKNACTLAIGDGANDVDMILEANVGVGIIGAEGVQAANSSDYSIGRFKFLQRLLLVHGRWNYTRISIMVLYSFYKNIMYSLAQWLFNFHSGWSGQKFYIEYGNQLFSIVYTGMPIVIMSIMEQDVSAANALKFPHLYADGRQALRLNNVLITWWVFTALYEACLIYFIAVLGSLATSINGSTPYVFELGTYIFTAEVIILNIRLVLNNYQHHAPFFWSTVASVFLWIPSAFIFDAVNADYTNGMAEILYGGLPFWLFMLFLTTTAAVPILLVHSVRHWMFPQYRDLVWDLQVLLPLGGKKPTGYQRFLTCCMRPVSRRHRPGARELLARLESLAPAIFPSEQENRRSPLPKSPSFFGPKLTPRSATAGTASTPDSGRARSLPPVKLFQSTQDGVGAPLARGSDARIAPDTSASSVLPDRLKAQMREMSNPPGLSGWEKRLRLAVSEACSLDMGEIPHAEDVMHELIEWPHNQRIAATLESMRRGGSSEDEVLVHQLLMVRARLVERVEAHVTYDPVTIASPTATPVAGSPTRTSAYPLTEVVVGPDAAASATVATQPQDVPAVDAPEEDSKPFFPPCAPSYRLPPLAPPAPSAAEALAQAQARLASVREHGLPPPILSTPSGGGLQWRKLRSIARMAQALQSSEKRTGSDFSCDAGHQSFYVGNMSSIGRRHSASGLCDAVNVLSSVRAGVLASAAAGRALDRTGSEGHECDAVVPSAGGYAPVERPASASAIHGSRVSLRLTAAEVFGLAGSSQLPSWSAGPTSGMSPQISGLVAVRASSVRTPTLENAVTPDVGDARRGPLVPRHPLVVARAQGSSFSSLSASGVALSTRGQTAAAGVAAPASPRTLVRPKLLPSLSGDHGGAGSASPRGAVARSDAPSMEAAAVVADGVSANASVAGVPIGSDITPNRTHPRVSPYSSQKSRGSPTFNVGDSGTSGNSSGDVAFWSNELVSPSTRVTVLTKAAPSPDDIHSTSIDLEASQCGLVVSLASSTAEIPASDMPVNRHQG